MVQWRPSPEMRQIFKIQFNPCLLGLNPDSCIILQKTSVRQPHYTTHCWGSFSMEKLFDLVGLGVPIYLAVATYGVFSWLDSNASDEATQVVSSWLHGYSRGKLDLGNIILNTFDRIYTFPLLRFRAFCRSVAISSILWVLVYLIPWLIKYHYLPEESELSDAMKHVSLINLFIGITFTLPFIILSDYISLFVVRKFLVLARAHPLKASVGAFIAGFLIVTIIFILLDLAFLPLSVYITHLELSSSSGQETAANFLRITLVIFLGGSFLGVLTPAIIIHLWLPLFALSSLLVKLLYLIFRAVEKAQWFLKQGDAHPLKAIGIVATIIVFGSAMLAKEGWALLSALGRS
jgi:hypothetical protein